ncbi:hypothetical protein C8T65DRAFT_633063 [Cerioporus squamosus]|nr:hypothetical protein C8T65DRAFT_633063 [Cerioporus squamosus]
MLRTSILSASLHSVLPTPPSLGPGLDSPSTSSNELRLNALRSHPLTSPEHLVPTNLRPRILIAEDSVQSWPHSGRSSVRDGKSTR